MTEFDAPTLTVGLPVFNDPDGLRRCVPMVFNQSWQGSLRLLIVDDGSTDETPEVISQLRDHYSNIDVIRNDVNRGRPYARNLILRNATGKYLAWIDSDDLWHPKKLESQFLALDERADEELPILCTCSLIRMWTDTGVVRSKAAATEGDQLFNALNGKLYPYLWTMLGRTEAFRSVGGFDERLLRRQDYDFLVRFIRAGGRVISTDPDKLLCTYLKTDVGRSGGEVARANAVIWRKHRSAYLRFGWQFAMKSRARQFALSARFFRANGQYFHWLVYHLGELSLDTLTGGKLRELADYWLRWLWHPLRDRSARLNRYVAVKLSWLVAFAGGTGLIAFARRTGATRLIGKLQLRPVIDKVVFAAGPGSAAFSALYGAKNGDGRVISNRAALEYAQSAITTGRLEDAIAYLSTFVGARGEDASPAVFVKLAEAYRKDGRLDAAMEALQHGHRLRPDHVPYLIWKAEICVLNGDWDAACRYWESVPESERGAAGHWAYIRMARTYRKLNDQAAALAVIEAGLLRYPRDAKLRQEARKARAQAVDWSRALLPAVGYGDGERAPTAVVDSLGCLRGLSGPITGRVWRSAGRTPEVALKVNDLPVVVTSASGHMQSDTGTIFSICCQDLLAYLGDGDLVSVQVDGIPAQIQDRGRLCMVHVGVPSNFARLKARVEEGYVFTKFGEFREGNSELRKSATLDLYDELATEIEGISGRRVYPFYGNLLGAVREHDFIAHDVGGFDIVYVTDLGEPFAIRQEVITLCQELLSRGYYLKLDPWSVMIRRSRFDTIFVDLNYAWFNDAGELNASYGWRFSPVTDRRALLTPRPCTLVDRTVDIPENAEDILVQLYGDDWAVPDQGFDPGVRLQRDTKCLLTEDELEAIRNVNPTLVEIRSTVNGVSQPLEAGRVA